VPRIGAFEVSINGVVSTCVSILEGLRVLRNKAVSIERKD